MLRQPFAPFLVVSVMLLAACGGATLSGPGSHDDAGGSRDDSGGARDAGISTDAPTVDAPSLGDGGCINPVLGEACTDTASACPQAGNPCCVGEWSCENGVWAQLGLGCACEIQPDAGPDCGAPSVPTYSCSTTGDAAVADGGACSAYGVDGGAGGPMYPLNCTVTLTTCDTSFGGAQTCNCQSFPGSGPQPTWVCPL